MNSARALLFVALMAAGCGVFGCDKAAARSEPPPPKVSVAHPELRELVDYDNYNGWLDSLETVEVRARVRGHIDKVNFTDGQIVKKGDVLFELDPRPFQAEVDRAAEQVQIYEAQLVAADREEARQKELVTKGAASQREVDKAEADAAALRAQIESSKHEITRKKLDLEYSRITAPIGGKIGRAIMTAGNLVNAGGSDPLLTTIVSMNPIAIYFHIDERALQRYQKTLKSESTGSLKDARMPFNFGRETDTGYPHAGVLDFADNRVDPTTGTILVRGLTPNEKDIFVPGSRVKVRLPITAARSVLLIPDTAVLSDQDKKYVLVVDDKNVVQRRDVAPGKLLDDGMRVVLAATKGEAAIGPNDWIIVQGLQAARVNYPVEPIRQSSQPPASTQPAPI